MCGPGYGHMPSVQLPEAAITKDHRLRGLKQQKLPLAVVEARAQNGGVGRARSIPVFQLLGAAGFLCVPLLIDSSLQSLPPSSRVFPSVCPLLFL